MHLPVLPTLAQTSNKDFQLNSRQMTTPSFCNIHLLFRALIIFKQLMKLSMNVVDLHVGVVLELREGQSHVAEPGM